MFSLCATIGEAEAGTGLAPRCATPRRERLTVKPYFDDGQSQIWLGDCREVLPLLVAESVDLVLTDPPYGVGFQSNHRKEQFDKIANDETLEWLTPVFKEVERVMKRDSLCISFYGWPHADKFVNAWRANGFTLVSHMVWVKNVWGFGHFTRACHEPAYLLAKGKPPIPDVAPSSVFEWTRETDTQHPTQKPIDAIRQCLDAYAGAVILDPFMGSGTTLRAAKDLGRKAIGIEIEEKYCEIAVKRLSQEVLAL